MMMPRFFYLRVSRTHTRLFWCQPDLPGRYREEDMPLPALVARPPLMGNPNFKNEGNFASLQR